MPTYNNVLSPKPLNLMKLKFLLMLCLTLSCLISFAQRDTLSATFYTSPFCQGPAILRINATGGYPPYEYSINGINYQSSNLFTFPGLSPLDSLSGIAFVRDSAGTVFSAPFFIPDFVYDEYYKGTVACGGDYKLKAPIFMGYVLTNVRRDTTVSLYIDQKCSRVFYHETIHVLPAYQRFDTVHVCPGTNYTFPDGFTYYNILQNISYTSRFQFAGGCDSLITTYVNIGPTEINVSDTVCQGSSYVFHDGTKIDHIETDQVYTYTVQLPHGCASRITTYLHVKPINGSVTVSQNVLTANEWNATYQWQQCTGDSTNYVSIPGAVGKSFIPVNEGYYALLVSKDGCIIHSDCISVLLTAINDAQTSGVMLYPNPAKEQIHVDFTKGSGSVQLEVYSSYGQKVYSNNLDNISSTSITMDNNPAGLYFIKLMKGTSMQVLEFIKE